MSEIKEISSNRYIYVGCDNVERELKFVRLRGKEAHKDVFGEYNCFKVGNYLGISRNYTEILSEPIYSTIACSHSSFNYTIKEIDCAQHEYIVYGKLFLDGNVLQDHRLNTPSTSTSVLEYTFSIPSHFAFICYIFGSYYLYKTKDFKYGLLEFDRSLRPKLIWQKNSRYLHNSFIYELFNPRICLLNKNSDNSEWSDVLIFEYYHDIHIGKYVYKDSDSKRWEELNIDKWLMDSYKRSQKKKVMRDDTWNISNEDNTDRDIWNAMTDGMCGDYPDDGYDGDYEFMGR